MSSKPAGPPPRKPSAAKAGKSPAKPAPAAQRPAKPGAQKAAPSSGKPGAPPARKPGKAAAGAKQEKAASQPLPEPQEERSESAFREFLRESPSWLVSLILHMAILLILALWALPPGKVIDRAPLAVSPNEQQEEFEEIVLEEIPELDVDEQTEVDLSAQPETTTLADAVVESSTNDLEAAEMAVQLEDIGFEAAPKDSLLSRVGSATGTGLAGRGKAARSALVAQGGGNAASEEAVTMALKWLATHQMPDGGWSYDHRLCPACQGKCDGAGKLVEARNAATAMGLLPFLGAGQTHKEGDYKEVVRRGLQFLGNSMKVDRRKGGSWHEDGGRMYSHGLASIVMCEAYGMTQDPELRAPAQLCVNYIVSTQDRRNGGWGYSGPGRDTSVSGWQIMALKSAHMAYLHVPPQTIRGIDHFLNLVQADSGASYGYRDPGRGAATTAVGVLMRMYMGWDRNHPALERAKEKMLKDGPSLGNLYRDYYAAQFMFQMTGAKGDQWDAWNTKLRDGLVQMQNKNGHTAGSWSVRGGHGGHGGRVMATCLSTLILEVYYRHMLLAKEEATEHEFPLE